MRFSQTDYQELHVSLAQQYAAGVARYLPRRAFSKLHNWANPDQVPGHIDDRGRLVMDGTPPEIPPIQRRAVRAIRDSLKASPTAQELLKIADRGRVTTGFEFDEEGSTSGAFYVAANREVLFNAAGGLMRHDKVEDFLPNAGHLAAHELAHVAQNYVAGPDYSRWGLRYPIMHQIIATRHYEAAADAVAIDVAWQLKEAGEPAMWAALDSDPFEQHLTQAYAASIAKNPANAANGKARRAAHDAWFKDAVAVTHYDDVALKNARNRLDLMAQQQAEGFPFTELRLEAREAGRHKLTKDQLRDYGTMPDGIDHLRLVGHPDVWATKYTAPSSAAMLRQAEIMHDMMTRLSKGLILHEGDFKALDHAKAICPDDGANLLERWRVNRRVAEPKPYTPSP